MKKTLALILCAALALCLVACGKAAAPAASGEESTQIANPFVEYETMDEAAAAVGLSLSVPETPEGYDDPFIEVIGGELLQLVYANEDSQFITVRKAAIADEDVSGDYNEYPQTRKTTLGDNEVLFKGADELVSVIIWSVDGYSYSVTYDDPADMGAALGLLMQVY